MTNKCVRFRETGDGRNATCAPAGRVRIWKRYGLLLFALSVPACGTDADRRSEDVDTLTLAYCCGDRVFSPMMDANARLLVFLPLVRFDERGGFEARLATSWEHSADFTTWVFHLRRDVRWHDGTPVTPHDVAFTINLWAHPDVRWYGAAGVDSTSVPDDSTVVIHYGRPTDALHYQPWLVYYPKHLLDELDPAQFYDWDFWSQPIGNGPYRYVRTTPATLMELRANERHYEGKPAIEKIVLRFVGEAGPVELVAGGVDILTDVEPAQALRFATDDRFQLHHSVSTEMALAVYWNHDVPVLEDAAVRRALVLAVDREELRAALGVPDDVPILDGPMTREHVSRGPNPFGSTLEYDPAESRRLLDAAGWVDSDGDGFRDRAGEVLQFTTLSADIPAFRQVAVLVQEKLRRVGVRMEIQFLDGGVVSQRVDRGEFEAAVRRTGLPSDWLSRFFGSQSRLGYRSARATNLIERLDATADQGERNAILREITNVFREEVPALFLFPEIRFVVAAQQVKGLSSPWRAEPTLYMEELRLGNPGL